MKKTLRLLFVAFVVVAMFALTMTTAMAAEAIVIDDATNAEAAFNQAIEAAKTSDVTVTLNADWVLGSDVTIGDENDIPENKITVNGTGSIDVEGKALILCGNFEFTSITLKGNQSGTKNAFFAPEGASITVKGITAVTENTERANIVGSNIHISDGTFFVVSGGIAGIDKAVEGADITVLGGTITRILGGSYSNNNSVITGYSNVVVGDSTTNTGPTVDEVVGGSWYAASAYWGAKVDIYGGTIKDLIACGLGYMSASAQERNSQYTVDWNGGTVSGLWCAGSLNGSHTTAQKLWFNAIFNINCNTTVDGFAGAADRSTVAAGSEYMFNADGTVVVNVANGKTIANIYGGSHMKKAGCTSSVDTTISVGSGVTANYIYGGSRINAANCVEEGNCTVNVNGTSSSKVTFNQDVVPGAYIGAAATGSTVSGKTTYNATYMNVPSKSVYAGSYNYANVTSEDKAVADGRDIEMTLRYCTTKTVYLGSYLNYQYAKRTGDAVVEIYNSTIANPLYGGSYLNGDYAKDTGTLYVVVQDTNMTGSSGNFYAGACFTKKGCTEDVDKTYVLTNVTTAQNSFMGPNFAGSATSSAWNKRSGDINVTLNNFASKSNLYHGARYQKAYSEDLANITVVLNGVKTTKSDGGAYTRVHAFGPLLSTTNTKFTGNLIIVINDLDDNDDNYYLGSSGGSGTIASTSKLTVVVETTNANAMSIVSQTSSTKKYGIEEYVMMKNGVAYAKITGARNNVQSAYDAIEAKNITVSENDFSIVGTSIRISNLAMRCRVKVSKNNSLDIKRMGVLVGTDNSKLYEFDIYTNLPSSNKVKDANAAKATGGLIENDKDYPNHNLFAAAVTGYEDKGVLDTTRATTNVYFRAYIVVEEDGIQKIVYTVPSGTETGSNYGKSLAQTANQLKNGVWYNGLADEKKSKVDEIAKLFKA